MKSQVFRKTEKILYIYPDIIEHENEFLNTIDDALRKLSEVDEIIIQRKYFDKKTHEEIAEELDVDPRTVTRKKNRIIKRLSFILFPDEAIEELKNE